MQAKNFVLTGKNLIKKFGSYTAVDHISITVKSGQAVGLLGPNGAGKTTSFSLIVGLETPDSGQIFLNENDITHMPLYQRAQHGIRYLPQDPSIFRGLTVEQNLLAVLEIFEKNAKKRQEQCDALLEEFGLTHIRRNRSISASGGERRRLEIARALIGNPKFLLLDEPLAGIDPKTIDDFRHLIRQLLKTHNIGILITDHNVRDTLEIVDRASILYNGSILKEGTPEEIIHDPHVQKTYLGHAFRL